ncbi:hypothetical protein M0R45_018591 [Rubus argutus]|uniref:Uncharacterized protein n=1 Tax=Rubus argutus TaxID=59490 RepID=A0AAW1X2X1_RUBAR
MLKAIPPSCGIRHGRNPHGPGHRFRGNAVLGEKDYIRIRAENLSRIDILHHIESWSPQKQQKTYETIADFEHQGARSTADHLLSYNDAISFRYKRISNWDDIVDLCGKDRATGEGAEISAEAIEVMTPPVNEVNHVDLEDDDQG